MAIEHHQGLVRFCVACGCAAFVVSGCAQRSRSSDDDDDAASGGGRASSSSTSATTGSGGTSNAGPIELVVSAATGITTSIQRIAPAPGSHFVVLDVTLSNSSIATPLSMALTSFSLRTDTSLVLLPSVVASSLAERCREDLAVSAGGMASCQLAFEMPVTHAPAELVYDDMQGHTSSAAVPAVQPLCSATATWQNTTSTACEDCLSASCYYQTQNWIYEINSGQCSDEWSCVLGCGGSPCTCLDQCLLTYCRQKHDSFASCAFVNCAAHCE